jgi:putative restriction endonuclease
VHNHLTATGSGFYNSRRALSGLPEPLLLDAAHIVADKDKQFGQ